LLVLAVTLAAMSGPAVAMAASGATSATGIRATAGFYQGKTIHYLDFGPIKLAPGNKVAPIWVVTNGTKAQYNIVDVVPGVDGYTPLWKVTMVTWKRGVAHRTLRSAGAVMAAMRAGQVTLKHTSIVVNCPVLGFSQKKTPGFAKGHAVSYLDLGAVKLRAGNKVAPIWVVTNGTSGQHNIVDTLPGDSDYTPLWAVRMVTWKDGISPRTLKSRSAVQAALDAGDVTVKPTSIVVNCPVV
jgi:hypothetical protein